MLTATMLDRCIIYDGRKDPIKNTLIIYNDGFVNTNRICLMPELRVTYLRNYHDILVFVVGNIVYIFYKIDDYIFTSYYVAIIAGTIKYGPLLYIWSRPIGRIDTMLYVEKRNSLCSNHFASCRYNKDDPRDILTLTIRYNRINLTEVDFGVDLLGVKLSVFVVVPTGFSDIRVRCHE